MKLKHTYSLTEGKPLSDGRKKNECRNERRPVGAESESHGRAEIRHTVAEARAALQTEIREIVATPQNFSTPALQNAIGREIRATIGALGLDTAKEEGK